MKSLLCAKYIRTLETESLPEGIAISGFASLPQAASTTELMSEVTDVFIREGRLPLYNP